MLIALDKCHGWIRLNNHINFRFASPKSNRILQCPYCLEERPHITVIIFQLNWIHWNQNGRESHCTSQIYRNMWPLSMHFDLEWSNTKTKIMVLIRSDMRCELWNNYQKHLYADDLRPMQANNQLFHFDRSSMHRAVVCSRNGHCILLHPEIYSILFANQSSHCVKCNQTHDDKCFPLWYSYHSNLQFQQIDRQAISL